MDKLKKSDVYWAYASQILYSGLNIFILPIVLRELSSLELGLWYTFAAIGAIATMLDFGFLSTILRNLTYAWNGAESIVSDGVVENTYNNGPNYQLFSVVLKATKYIYLVISLISLVLCLSLGSIYVYSISNSDLPISSYMPGWVCYAIAVALNIYYAYWTPVLRSAGGIRQSYQILVISKVIQLIVSVFGLLMGYGLLAISLAYLLSQGVNRIISKFCFHRLPEVSIAKDRIYFAKIERQEILTTLREMWPNAYKQGVIAISKFLTSKASILICSSFLGLKLSSQYGLTGQLFGIITTLSNVMINSYSPTIGGLYVKGDRKGLYSLFTKTYGFQLLFSACGSIVLFLCGQDVLNLLGSGTSLLSTLPLILVLLIACINNSFEVCCSYIALGNKVPMYRARIITSICMVTLQLILAIFFPQVGIYSIIVPSFLCLLAYNCWRWIKYISDDFGVSLLKIHWDSILSFMGRKTNKM